MHIPIISAIPPAPVIETVSYPNPETEIIDEESHGEYVMDFMLKFTESCYRHSIQIENYEELLNVVNDEEKSKEIISHMIEIEKAILKNTRYFAYVNYKVIARTAELKLYPEIVDYPEHPPLPLP